MNEQNEKLEQEIESGEAWLAAYRSPAPTADAVNRAKRAARREFARRRGGPSVRSWRAWQGALGAAAALALCVTAGWFAASRQGSAPPTTVAEIDVQPLWPATTQQETTVLAALDDDLSELEDWSSENSWNASGASLYYALEDALGDDSGSNGLKGNGASMESRTQG